MTFTEAIRVAGVILSVFGGLAAVGGLGMLFLAWADYRLDGGRLGFWKYLRGL